MEELEYNSKNIMLAILCYLNTKASRDEYIKQKDIVDFLNEDLQLNVKRQTVKEYLHAISEFDTFVSENGYVDESASRLIETAYDDIHVKYKFKKVFSPEQLLVISTFLQSSIFLDKNASNDIYGGINALSDESFSFISINSTLRAIMLNKNALGNIGKIDNAIQKKKKLSFYLANINRNQELYYYKRIYDEHGNAKNKYISYQYSERSEPIITETIFDIDNGEVKGLPIVVSPYRIVWDNSRCYMVCSVKADKGLRFLSYRIDRMFEVSIEKEKRELPNKTSPFYSERSSDRFNARKFLLSSFNMFTSDESEAVEAEFKVHRRMVRIMVERFGFDVDRSAIQDEEEYYFYRTFIQPSKGFFSWLSSYEPADIKLVSPPKLVREYKEHLKNIISGYDE